MLSVGIDVGTTTTQLVMSRLTVRNKRRFGLVPRLDIDATEVVFVSDPKETPLVSPDEIDVDSLIAMIRAEYAAAGIAPAQVETGAIIITGETARTRNAEAILNGLSDLAGDFVVTVAGPNVESLIAGRGSGAAAWSAEHFTSVVAVDIGGGSSNAALFRSGAHVASSASMVGGRQARLERETGILTHLAPSGRIIAEELHLDLTIGRVPTMAALRGLTDAMADIIVDLCLGRQSPLGERVALTDQMRIGDTVTAYFISGGVGLLYYDEAPAETVAQVAAFGDVGPLLARSLRENERSRRLRVERPEQTLRATVLGAASQQVTLSGSTIWADGGVLPLRNLPVIEPLIDPELAQPAAVRRGLADAHGRWDRGGGATSSVAIALDLPPRLGYGQINALATGITDFARDSLAPGTPLVMVTEEDYAKVLGQTIKASVRARAAAGATASSADLPLVVIDQIDLGEGDFIDIGEPMLDGRVVPVSVKTLVFYQQPAT